MDSNPGGYDTALTQATLLLTAVTFCVAVVPIIVRLWEIHDSKKAGRLQLDIILQNFEVRIVTLVNKPEYSKRVLLAGIDGLFTRALSGDFADVRPPTQMERVYEALSSAYKAIVSAFEEEQYLEEEEKAAPRSLTATERADFRKPGDQRWIEEQAKPALHRLSVARELLKGGGVIRGIFRPTKGVKALRNPFVQGFR